MELLKAGDFVIVYNIYGKHLERGMVIVDEAEGNQVYVVVSRVDYVNQDYYDRHLIVKVC